MTEPPAQGIERLSHFVDARLAQLGFTKEQAARAGFPSRATLAKAQKSPTQTHPTVRTLARIDAAAGWQPGSAAVTLLGGTPVSISARSRLSPDTPDITPLTGEAVHDLLIARIRDEIAVAQRDIDATIQRMRRVSGHLDAIADACDGLDDTLLVAKP